MRPTDEQILKLDPKDAKLANLPQDPQPCALTGTLTGTRVCFPGGAYVPLVESKINAAGWKELQGTLKKKPA